MKGMLWLVLYFVCNICLTLHNKSVLTGTAFAFPWSLTALHSIASAVGSLLCIFFLGVNSYTFGRDWTQWAWLVAFSLLYTVNIAISNVSMSLVLLSFHQTVRSLGPLFTCSLDFLVTGRTTSWLSIASLVPVVVGVALACYGPFGASLVGGVLTFIGVFLSSAKGVATNIMLIGPLRLKPFDLLLRMSVLCTVQCLAYAWFSGELREAALFLRNHDNSTGVAVSLAFNAALAFGLSFVSFSANKSTSSVSMAVVGNVKQVLLILLTVILFADPINGIQTSGIVITFIGGALYTWTKA
jgi:drug/metabolite transporter (DMT)-like permease